jgi:outer membrane protein OmpA-like peptidoglycan-associated protein
MGQSGQRLGRATTVAILLWVSQPSAGQQIGPDDPLPPAAHGEVLALRGEVLPLKVEVLPLKVEILDMRGLSSGMAARVESLQGALRDLGATVKGREIKINLSADVLFDFDKWDLRPEAGPALAKVVAVLQSYPKASVLIEGHTDGKGNDQYNQRLSERRAESVRGWLAEHGVNGAMATRGWGKTHPVAPNTKSNGADNPKGRQRNRRVEITIST